MSKSISEFDSFVDKLFYPEHLAIQSGFSFCGNVWDALSDQAKAGLLKKELPGLVLSREEELQSNPLASSFSTSPAFLSQLKTKRWQKEKDEIWMIEALREAQKSSAITSPNPAVGCILVDSTGNEVARGSTEAYRGRHAETLTLSRVKHISRLRNATLYVTLEPCSHWGNQPPCVDAILKSEIQRIVIACLDPHFRVNGQGIQSLLAAGKEVQTGLLASETLLGSFAFFFQNVFSRPLVGLKWAQAAAESMTLASRQTDKTTNPLTQSYLHSLRLKYDALLVESSTFIQDAPSLDFDDCAFHPTDFQPLLHPPLPVLFDPMGECLNLGEIAQKRLIDKSFISKRDFFYVTTAHALRKSKSTWLTGQTHAQILVLKEDFNVEPDLPSDERKLSALIKRPKEARHSAWVPELLSELLPTAYLKLTGKPLQSLLIEGGDRILSPFIHANFCDYFHIFLTPSAEGNLPPLAGLRRLLQLAPTLQVLARVQLLSDLVLELAPYQTMSTLQKKIRRT